MRWPLRLAAFPLLQHFRRQTARPRRRGDRVIAQCLLLALFGSFGMSAIRSLSGVKRTYTGPSQIDANDRYGHRRSAANGPLCHSFLASLARSNRDSVRSKGPCHHDLYQQAGVKQFRLNTGSDWRIFRIDPFIPSQIVLSKQAHVREPHLGG